MLNTMNIESSLLTVNQFSRPGKKLAGMRALVIHWAANPGSTAKQNRNYFESLKTQSLNDASARYASAHFIAGLEGEVIECIPREEMACHAGSKTYTSEAIGVFGCFPNSFTIGIELCRPKAEGRFTRETLEAAEELCALLCMRSCLDPLKDIWTHRGITAKVCPKRFADHPGEFTLFKERVSAVIETLGGQDMEIRMKTVSNFAAGPALMTVPAPFILSAPGPARIDMTDALKAGGS